MSKSAFLSRRRLKETKSGVFFFKRVKQTEQAADTLRSGLAVAVLLLMSLMKLSFSIKQPLRSEKATFRQEV